METDYCEYEANHDPFLEEKAVNVLGILRRRIENENISIIDLMAKFEKTS